MPPKKAKSIKAKSLGLKAKSFSKGHKDKKRKNKKTAYATYWYSLLPKRKRLKEKVVKKLIEETDKYTIARGVDAIKKLDKEIPLIPLDGTKSNLTLEEQKWNDEKKGSTEYKAWRHNKIIQIHNRALKRRKRKEAKLAEELKRKRYRFHPNDPFHRYIEGYKKSRHRISKQRFMKCVDIPLFEDVLSENRELIESPLWSENLHLKNLSVHMANKLKDHLHQFDVLVECLKQGIFDLPGCDDLPPEILRRKKKKGEQQTSKESVKRKKKLLRTHSNSSSRTRKLKRRLSFPPYEASHETLLKKTKSKNGTIKAALQSLTSWMRKSTSKPSQTVLQILPERAKKQKPNEGDVPSSVTAVQSASEIEWESDTDIINPKSATKRPSRWGWTYKSSPYIQSSSPPEVKRSHSVESRKSMETNEGGPFGNLLTIPVPTGPRSKKKFIRALVERKSKKKTTQRNIKVKSAAIEMGKREEEARQRHERVEKSDPLQKLHRDERDSDIWTVTSTTTTDGYASWRRPRDIRNAGDKQEILAHKVDTTFGMRIVLLLIVLWEIGTFVKDKLEDIYYWIYTSHLYRENIWLFEPSLYMLPKTFFPDSEKYIILNMQQWMHAIFSTISISIIHRENECVSILFAFSLLIDGVVDLGVSTHDYVYLPQFVGAISVLLTLCQVVWKVFIICLFIGYHYYCSGYIRKAREFDHRKIKLHNHEIKAKGTKGIQKRRLAWNWMTRHARNTNLRQLKKLYPNVKDGNFPEDELEKHIKFSEDKELRLYTLKHSLNIGYPYNKLRDMKRYVFQKLEKSDYEDAEEEKRRIRKKQRQSALTVSKWKDWKDTREMEHEERGRIQSALHRFSLFVGGMRPKNKDNKNNGLPRQEDDHTYPATRKTGDLTIDRAYVHRTVNKLKKEDT